MDRDQTEEADIDERRYTLFLSRSDTSEREMYYFFLKILGGISKGRIMLRGRRWPLRALTVVILNVCLYLAIYFNVVQLETMMDDCHPHGGEDMVRRERHNFGPRELFQDKSVETYDDTITSLEGRRATWEATNHSPKKGKISDEESKMLTNQWQDKDRHSR